MSTSNHGARAEFISAQRAAAMLGVDKATVARRLQRNLYRHEVITGNGGRQYSVDVSSLPIDAQHRYLAQQLKAAHPPADRRAALQRLELEEQAEREVARAAGITRKHRPAPQPPLTIDESQAARLAFEKLCDRAQEEAHHRVAVMQHFTQLDPSLPKLKRYQIAADAAGESATTLRRWHGAIKQLALHDWAPKLAPAWGKGRPKVGLSDEAMQFIMREWGCQSQPSLQPIYRRAQKEAERQGWALPSYKTVLRRINAIPAPQRALLREGEEALDRLIPALERDYSTLGLHDIWCSDGRKADVFCVWPDGYVGRPHLLAWQELRARKILGWAIGKAETSDLARLAFRDAALSANAIPIEAYLDNGMAFAAKSFTGGQPTRNRFKIKPDDPIGILSIFGVAVIWATPGRGQAKPIESYWNTIAEGERCAAFSGSWCGHRPDARPEDFDPKRLIPIADYKAFVREAIEEKNARAGHRGDSMGDQSPDLAYAALSLEAPARQPSRAQLQWCLMAAEQVKLDKQCAFKVLGNRYWNERLHELDRSATYTVRFDDADLDQVALFAGRRHLFDVPIWRRTGFRNKEAAADGQRAKNKLKRAHREAAKSLLEGDRAARSWEVTPEPSTPTHTKALPPPKVARLVQPPLQLHVDQSTLRSREEAERASLDFEADRARGRQMILEKGRQSIGG